jgi:hypothetical protein
MSSVKIDPPDPAKKNFQGGLCSELYPCSPGAKIKFSAWVFTGGSEGIDEIRIKIRNAKQSGGEHLTMVTVKTSPDLPYWTKVEGEATAPEGANNVEVSFKRAQNATGFIFVDDFSLTTDGKELLKNGSFEK